MLKILVQKCIISLIYDYSSEFLFARYRRQFFEEYFLVSRQAWTISAADADRACSGAQNFWDAPDFLGIHILPCRKEKNNRSAKSPFE